MSAEGSLPATPGSGPPEPSGTGPAPLAGALLVAIGVPLPWLHTEWEAGGRLVAGLDAPLLLVPVLLCTAVSLLLHAVSVRDWIRSAARVTGGLGAALTVVVLLAVEGAGASPRSVIEGAPVPRGVAWSSGAGLWLAAAGATLTTAGPGTRLDAAARRAAAAPRSRDRAVVWAWSVLVVLVVVAAGLRYLDWVATGPSAVSGWALPLAGPVSLFGVVLAALAIVAGATSRRVGAALLAGAGGWLLTVSSGVVAVVTTRLAFARVEAADTGQTFDLLAGPWLTFATGLLIAGCGAVVLRREPVLGGLR